MTQRWQWNSWNRVGAANKMNDYSCNLDGTAAFRASYLWLGVRIPDAQTWTFAFRREWSPGDTAAQQWWSDVSDIYARNMSGEVHAVVGSVLRPGNIWETVELPRLIENLKVSKIIVVDPETGAERIIFER